MNGNPPVVRIGRGHPTTEELAALVSVLTALSSVPAAAPEPTRRWASPAARLRTAYGPSRGGWRASGMPRQPSTGLC